MLKKTTPGDLLKVKCKTHGPDWFIAGIDFPAGEPLPDPKKWKCPRCRVVETGKRQVGEGFIDSRGVAYVVGVDGNLRHVDKLKDHQANRIRARRGKK